MKVYQRLLFCILTGALFLSCQNTLSGNNPGENSIYYWRTTFSLSDPEKDFLQKHDIRKMYVRFFDVDYSFNERGEEIVPEATIQFVDSVPNELEIIPTIYITTKAIEEMQLNEDEYAERILRRVKAMCAQNKIDFNEIQLDCDWTKRTQPYFFRLCEAMKSNMDSTMMLSSTIRLHQLTQTPPPVDRGVLMVYNTGNMMEMTTENSIFSRKDIEPYLRDNRLAKYSLPLDVAYPAYGWSLVFYPGGDKYYFNRIMQRTDFSNYPGLKKIRENLYEATEQIDFSDQDYIFENSRVKIERPTSEEILKVKEQIEKQLKGKPHNNIIYHLDETQLKHYSDNEISKIYSCN